MHQVHSSSTLQQVLSLECANRLVEVSDYLPTLVAGAYSMFSRGQLSAALIDSWIAIEQILDFLWQIYLSDFPKKRKRRLNDTRTYTAAVRIEMLHTVDVLPATLYESLNTARKHRNDLAHRAKISIDMATEVVGAMKETIEFFTKISVAPPLVNRGVNW